MSEWILEEVNKVSVNGEVKREIGGEITAEVVKQVAREAGIKQLGVRDADGGRLSPTDFPVNHDVDLFQINKAGM